MVRDYSTNGGHRPGDQLVEGKNTIRKWQGYAPENLNVVGKLLPPLPEVSIPRFTGKAQYASRVWFPDMLYVRFLTCPHPHARIKSLDTATAGKMPGVAYILTYKNAPKAGRTRSCRIQGCAGTAPAGAESPGRGGCDGCGELRKTSRRMRPMLFRWSTKSCRLLLLSKTPWLPDAPDLGKGKGNLLRPKGAPENATWADQQGDLEKGFAQADVIKEFTYRFAGAVSVPMQPSGSVARWDKDRQGNDKLTFWGMGQGIYPVRAVLAAALDIEPSKIRFINKYNGSTFGAARLAAERFYPLIAHLAKVTGKPVKVMLPKDQELAQLQIKPETITKFKVGARKDGHITAIQHEVYVSAGDLEFGGHASGPGSATNQMELYTSTVPHWKSTWSAYRTNAPRPGPSRSYYQQETKWSWESMMDEMADTLGLDPVQFRLMHITRPKARRCALPLRLLSIRGSPAGRRKGLRLG